MDYSKDTPAKDVKDTFKTKDALCRYVFLKTEKLTSALYIITDFLSDKEPLKWKLRELALSLVFEANSLTKDKKDFFGISGLGRVSFEINNIIILLDVAYVGGAVSQMNFEILKQEYQNLSNLINTRLEENSFKRFVSDESLGSYTALVDNSANHWSQRNEVSTAPSVSFGVHSSNEKNNNNLKAQNKVPLGSPMGQKDIKKDTINDLYGLNSKTEKKSIRKEQIINFLKDKSWTGIMDISKVLPDCGAKTVQRELLDMVSNNILKKQGERRWSKYMLS